MWSNGELHYKSAAYIVTGYYVFLKMYFNNADIYLNRCSNTTVLLTF